MTRKILLAATGMLAAAAAFCVHSSEITTACDGQQMYNYVDVALRAGGGVVNVANDPAYGGGSVSLALKSQNMRLYNAMIVNIREHDLSLARSGCKSLINGPTKGMMSTLRQVESKIQALVASQYREQGLMTDGFGEAK